jgi:uncharacterized linocin/CFP29 family protein
MSGLTLGDSYKIQVSSINEQGESDLSESNTILFANVPSEPATISLSAQDSPPQIVVEWTAPSDINGDIVRGYHVYVDNGYGGPFNLVLNATGYPSTYRAVIGKDPQAEGVTLTCGLLYQVQVSALNSAGEGAFI